MSILPLQKAQQICQWMTEKKWVNNKALYTFLAYFKCIYEKEYTCIMCFQFIYVHNCFKMIQFKKLFLTNICEISIIFLVLGLIEMKQDTWSNKIRVKPGLSQQQPSCAFQAKSMKVTGKIKKHNLSDSVNTAVDVGSSLFCPTVSLLCLQTPKTVLPIICTM